MLKRRIPPSLIALAVLVLTGCGGQDPAATTPSAMDAIPVTGPGNQYQVPASTGSATPGAATSNPQGVQALQHDVYAAFQSLQGYSAHLQTVDSANGYHTVSNSDVKFRKPEVVRIDIQSNSDDSSQAGTKAVWQGGSSITVRPSGLLGFATVNLATSDSRLVTHSGWRIDQISLRANITTFMNPSAKIQLLGHGQMGSMTLVFADVTGPIAAQSANHLKLGFDYQSKLPVFVDFMSGPSVLYSMRMTNVSLSAPDSSEFQL